jgi:rSAM/selenodomain-associated transferase 1
MSPIMVFARAPVPGAVKTRLIPVLGPQGAAALHARLTKRTIETARRARMGAVELHCAPDHDDPFFRLCSGRYGVELVAQAPGDLGARMHAAFRRGLEVHPRALLVGSDCAVLTARLLRQADRALAEGADAVFAPCEDGGYALIGLKREDPRLFAGIAWGEARVMADTRDRLRALGWQWRELDTVWDVDRPEDYERLTATNRGYAAGSAQGIL